MKRYIVLSALAAAVAFGGLIAGMTTLPSTAEAQSAAAKCRQEHYPPGAKTSESVRVAYNECLKRARKK